jgi:uncharacterized membrane protein YhhN
VITVFVLFTLAATALLVWTEVAASPALRWVKMAASTGFIGIAVASGATSTVFGSFVLAALVLSWIGDLLLTYDDRKAFTAGLVSFLLGHVAFSVGFGVLGIGWVVALGAAVVVAVVAAFVWRWLSPHVGDMAAPVAAYVGVISIMTVMAFGAFGGGATVLIPVGAVLFFVSDMFVARNQFVAPGLVNRVWGLPLYYGAQILLALSVAR